MSRTDRPIYQILQSKSDFFCPAKWTELYLYLNHGTSNSCHHPLPHTIPHELLDNVNVLHNTPHKLAVQAQMLHGQRPDECHMCWHIEDMNQEAVSDRILKSETWVNEISSLDLDPNYVPPFIEVVFDNYCNLSCSYCDAGQSSSWAAKVHRQPLLLDTDHRELYSRISIPPGSTKQQYLEAWHRWWPTIKHKVNTLKISGGEPLMSKNFWHFAETINPNELQRLDINSNLSVDQDTMLRFIQVTSKVKKSAISASLDATGDIAEYARQGLDYNLFCSNLHLWCTSDHTNNMLWLQSTINALSVWGLIDKLDFYLQLRRQYPDKIRPFYTTLVRYPEFQSVLIMPLNLRQNLSRGLVVWVQNHRHELSSRDIDLVQRTAAYLISNPQPVNDISVEKLQVDFKKFLLYYNKGAKKTYQEVYPEEFCHWIDSI